MDAQIQRLMDQHPDREIFRSFPGAGPCLAPRLLVAFGTNRERFRSAVEVAQFYGIAPVMRQSGTTKTVHVRTRCPKFGRQTYHENAGCALREELWASAFHCRYKHEHDSRHHQANRSLAFKLIRVYFACWKNRTPYDPEKYENALEASGSPYAATRRVQKTVNNSKPNS
jgi:transposase